MAGAVAPVGAGRFRRVFLRTLPAGRLVIALKGFGPVKARRAIWPAGTAGLAAAIPTVIAVACVDFGDFDMGLRQFIEKARGDGRLPQPVDATVGDKPDVATFFRPRQTDIGEPPLFLEAGASALIQRALMGKKPFLPAGQEHGLEFQPLGRMQRHDGDSVMIGVVFGIHDKGNVLQERAQRFKAGNRLDQFFQVFQP